MNARRDILFQKSRVYVVDCSSEVLNFTNKYPDLAVVLDRCIEDFDVFFGNKSLIFVRGGSEAIECLNGRGVEFEYLDFGSIDELKKNLSEKLEDLSMCNFGFSYKGVDYSVEFHSLIGKKIPDAEWCRVYVVGDLGGKVPVVIYDKKGKESRNLPGGGVEAGERVEDTLCREILEELNMEVLSFEPIGHQINYGSDGQTYHQLRVYARLKSLGDFKKDVGGSVIGYDLVNIKELNKVISWGEVGDWFSLVLGSMYERPE